MTLLTLMYLLEAGAVWLLVDYHYYGAAAFAFMIGIYILVVMKSILQK